MALRTAFQAQLNKAFQRSFQHIDFILYASKPSASAKLVCQGSGAVGAAADEVLTDNNPSDHLPRFAEFTFQ